MIRKRYLITGLVEAGDYIRLILYPDEPVQKKKMSLMDMAGLNPEEMQKQAITQGVLANNPTSINITAEEYMKNEKINLHEHIIVSIEVE